VKNLIKTFFSLLLITQAYSQWIEKQLPIQSDVWGLESKDSVVFAGTEIGFQGPGYVFRSMDYGVSWDTIDGLPYAGGWCFDFSDSILVAGSFGWGIHLSSDLGNTWTIPDSGIIPNENVHIIFKHKTYVFAGTAVNDNGILRSSDNGYRWIPVNAGLPIGSFLSLASNGRDLYTGMAYTGQVFRSTDDGMNWFFAGNGLPANAHIAVLASRDSNVYAGLGSGEGVYYSSNNGENWINISSSASIGQVWTLVLADTNLFVGSIGTGVFLTQNNGISWTAVNEGLTHLNIRSLLITSDNYLFAGTTNGFVCYRPISEMTTEVENQSNEIPSQFTLEQNYPNPFNPSTKIRYSVPQSSNVMIKVFDILGNEIETLFNGEKPVGTYEITWNAESLPSGIYFYKLQAGSFIETKKMIYIK
jgi:photosystem II stability/assembly factor-like uncharacterized protein